MKINQEELEDFLRVRSTLGFKLFLKVIEDQISRQQEKILDETETFSDIIPQQQAIGAARALKYLLTSHTELVKQLNPDN